MQTVLGDSAEDVMRRPRSWQQGQHSNSGKKPYTGDAGLRSGILFRLSMGCISVRTINIAEAKAGKG